MSLARLHLSWLLGGPVTITPDVRVLGGTGTVDDQVGVEVSGAVKVTVDALDGGIIFSAKIYHSKPPEGGNFHFSVLTPSGCDCIRNSNPGRHGRVYDSSTRRESENNTSQGDSRICCGDRNDEHRSGISYNTGCSDSGA